MKNDRYLDGKKVSPVLYYDYYSKPKVRGMLVGQIDGKILLDENGRPIPYRNVGELEGTVGKAKIEKNRYK